MNGRERIQRFKSALERNIGERREENEQEEKRIIVDNVQQGKENMDPLQQIVAQTKKVELRRNAMKNNSNVLQENRKNVEASKQSAEEKLLTISKITKPSNNSNFMKLKVIKGSNLPDNKSILVAKATISNTASSSNSFANTSNNSSVANYKSSPTTPNNSEIQSHGDKTTIYEDGSLILDYGKLESDVKQANYFDVARKELQTLSQATLKQRFVSSSALTTLDESCADYVQNAIYSMNLATKIEKRMEKTAVLLSEANEQLDSLLHTMQLEIQIPQNWDHLKKKESNQWYTPKDVNRYSETPSTSSSFSSNFSTMRLRTNSLSPLESKSVDAFVVWDENNASCGNCSHMVASKLERRSRDTNITFEDTNSSYSTSPLISLNRVVLNEKDKELLWKNESKKYE